MGWGWSRQTTPMLRSGEWKLEMFDTDLVPDAIVLARVDALSYLAFDGHLWPCSPDHSQNSECCILGAQDLFAPMEYISFWMEARHHFLWCFRMDMDTKTDIVHYKLLRKQEGVAWDRAGDGHRAVYPEPRHQFEFTLHVPLNTPPPKT